ncbi:MAG: DUF1499 domain-containing protein [Burkholderiales bacterium]
MLVLKWAVIGLVVLALAVVIAGRLGLLQGSAPPDLGVRDGRLKPPSPKANSVSSQAQLHPQNPRHEQAQIAPLRYQGDGAAAWARLQTLVEATPGASIVKREADYLYVTCTTSVLRFVDDVEFWLDPAGGVIQVRSASRLGESDLGANRARIEALRAKFEPR